MKNKNTVAVNIAECGIFVALMTAAAYIQIPFPLVPLTFQTAVSVLAGLLLGAKKGAVSMSVYAFAGLAGLPLFSAGGGIYYVLKPSFGYILGFIAAAFVAGIIAGKADLPVWRYVVAAMAAFLVNYAIGIPYCIICAKFLGVQNLVNLLITGNLIYMPKDAALCALAAILSRRVCPAIGRAVKNRR